MVSYGQILFSANEIPLEMLQICANVALQVGLNPGVQDQPGPSSSSRSEPSTSANESSQPPSKRRNSEDGPDPSKSI